MCGVWCDAMGVVLCRVVLRCVVARGVMVCAQGLANKHADRMPSIAAINPIPDARFKKETRFCTNQFWYRETSPLTCNKKDTMGF